MYDEGLFELEDIQDIVLSYADTCFFNHDLDDLRQYLEKKRSDLYKSLEKSEKTRKNL